MIRTVIPSRFKGDIQELDIEVTSLVIRPLLQELGDRG